MNRPTDAPCLAVICNPYGVVTQVLRDDLEIMDQHRESSPFPTLTDPDNTQKAFHFLETLRDRGAVSNWELVISDKGTLRTFHFSGGHIGEEMLIVGSTTASETEEQFQDMMRICTQQTNMLREQTKQNAKTAQIKDQNEEVIDDLSRLNNQLVSTQRELAKKNQALETLYGAEQRRVRELNSLYQATISLLSTLDLDPLLEDILEAAFEALPQAQKGVLILKKRSGSDMKVKASRGWDEKPEIEEITTAAGDEIKKAHKHRKPLVIDRPPGEENRPLFKGTSSEGSGLIIPLVMGQEIIGDLILYTTDAQALERADLQLWQAFGATATAAIQNAYLHERIQKLAITDPLTGIHNRRGFTFLARQQLRQARRYDRPLTLLMLDLDHFKRVNDKHGHQVGDQVLVEVSRRLKEELREADPLGRYGGEEFIILLPETTKKEGERIAHRLLKSIRNQAVETDAGEIQITISIGLAFKETDSELDKLIQKADQALYRAKEMGRDQVQS